MQLCFCPKMAWEAISDDLVSKIFPGGACPQTTLLFVCLCMHTFISHVTPLLKILATGLLSVPSCDLTHEVAHSNLHYSVVQWCQFHLLEIDFHYFVIKCGNKMNFVAWSFEFEGRWREEERGRMCAYGIRVVVWVGLSVVVEVSIRTSRSTPATTTTFPATRMLVNGENTDIRSRKKKLRESKKDCFNRWSLQLQILKLDSE